MKLPLFVIFFFLACPIQAQWYGSAGKTDISPDLSRPVYLAGYSAKGRLATGIQDPLFARGIALSDGKRKIVLISLDLIGFPRPYVEQIRNGLTADYILVAANHTHSGPDTLGLWGPKAGISGVDPVYIQAVIAKTKNLAKQLLHRLEPVRIQAAKTTVPPQGIVRDLRNPVVIDNELNIITLESLRSKKRIGTLVKWSCHPEVLGFDNTLATGDYGSYLTRRVDQALGGVSAYFSGAIGGLMSPDSQADTFEESKRIGEALADHAIAAVSKETRPIAAGSIAISSMTVRLPIENNLYLTFINNVLHGRKLYDDTGRVWEQPWWNRWPRLAKPFAAWISINIMEEKPPFLETEAASIKIGNDIHILAVPGEIFPELILGGYDGAFKFHHPVVDPQNPSPPNLQAAPRPPYLKEKMQGHVKMVFGLANDEIGYIVPEYDFKINALSPILYPRPKGHHYEETNSLGKTATTILMQALGDLLEQQALHKNKGHGK